MDLSRRAFLKATGIASIGAALASLGVDMPKVKAAAKEFKLKGAKEFTSICHFCACGCGVVGSVKDGKLINSRRRPGQSDQPRRPLLQGPRLRPGTKLQRACDEAAVPCTGQRPLGGDLLG